MTKLTYERSLRIFLAAGAMLVPAYGAEAQESVKNDSDIIVTARKKDERLIDVPASISVLDSASLARYSTSDFASVGKQMPQVILTKSLGVSTGGQLTVRGIGSSVAGDDSVEQSVSFNLDGVSSSRGRLMSSAMFDVANVQVLKGPQALYFGKNSPAGVVVVESKNPGQEFEGYIQGGYEFTAKEYQVEGAVSGPVSDTLGLRFAFFHADMQDGYVENIAPATPAALSPITFDRVNGLDAPGRSHEWGPGSKQTAGRLTAVFTPNTQFDATIKLLAANYEDEGENAGFVTSSCAFGGNTRLQVDLGEIGFTGAPGVFVDPYAPCKRSLVQSIGALNPTIAAGIPGSNGGKQFSESETYLASATMNYQLENIKLTSVTSFYKGEASNFDDYALTSFAILPASFASENESFSQELRVSTEYEGPLNATVGAYYSSDSKTFIGHSGLVRTADPALGLNGPLYSARPNSENDGTSYSVFGELSWKIVPNLELSGGARYSREEKETRLVTDYVQPGLVPLLGVTLPQGQVINAEANSDNVSPQVTLTYQPDDNTTLYAGYRTGFKSGGVANPGLIPATATAANVVYEPEKSRGYEAGIKFKALSNRLYGDIAVYHYTFSNLQVSTFDVTTSTLKIANAASADINGVEATLTYEATNELSFRASAGYNKARYGRFNTAACWDGQSAAQGCVGSFQDLTGQQLSRAPDWTASAGVTWDHPITSSLAIVLNTDVRYSGAFNPSTSNNPFANQEEYTLLDAAIKLRNIDDKWEIALIGKNLTDEYYELLSTGAALSVQPGTLYGLPGDPQTLKLQATYRF